MYRIILDYYLDGTSFRNSQGTYPVQFPLATYIPGGGPGYLVDLDTEYVDALDLGDGAATVKLSALTNTLATWDRFHFRVMFQCPPSFEGKRTLFTLNPGAPFFAFYLLGERGSIHLVGLSSGSETASRGSPDLKPGIWYVGELVYDHDTMFVLLDGAVIATHGFGKNATRSGVSPQPAEVIIGGPDGLGLGFDKFGGRLAAFFLEVEGFQPQIETRTDLARLTAEWYITTRVSNMDEKRLPNDPPEFDPRTFAWTQSYGSDLLVMYHSNSSAAYTLSGDVLDFYRKTLQNDERIVLGHLMCDQVDDGEKNQIATFSNGAIYIADGLTNFTFGQLYLDYQNSGGRRVWGFPVQRIRGIHSGITQEMQNGKFFLRDGASSAHAVKGDVVRDYNPDAWGFPIVDESDVYLNGFSVGTDRMSEFETCTVYSTPSTGTHRVSGVVRDFYDSIGGPTKLGFPTTDERPLSGSNASAQVFGDNIIWTNGVSQTYLIVPFTLYLQELDTSIESVLDSANKLYVNTYIHYVTGSGTRTQLPSSRLPTSGSNYGSRSFVPGINTAFSSLIIVKDVTDSIVIEIVPMDDDAPDSDDFLGNYKFTLDASNAWGFNIPTRKFKSGFLPPRIRNVLVELKPLYEPVIPTEMKKFWRLENVATPRITDYDFSRAFLDLSDARSVQPLPEVQDAFYELAIRDMAVTGNCFGMCQEAILARKFMSRFDFVLNQYGNVGEVLSDWSLRQQYQAGAAAWWWWADQVITPKALSPINVFKLSEQDNRRGSRPVITLFDTRGGDKKTHCVFPTQWRGGVNNTIEIVVIDPITGFNPQPSVITINLSNDTFQYQNWNSNIGSKLHYVPWGLVNRSPRTGTCEQMLCSFDGTVIAMHGDAHTERITDFEDSDLNVFSDRAKRSLDAGRRLDGHFSQLPVYMSGGFPGEILLSRGVAPKGTKDLGGTDPDADPVDKPLQLADASEPLYPLQQLEALQLTRAGDFRHVIVGEKKKGNNRLKYFVKSNLCHMTINCDLQAEERMEIQSRNIGTTNARYSISNNRPKLMTIKFLHRHGFSEGGHKKKDFVSVSIDLQWKTPGTLIIAMVPGLVRFDLIPSANGILDEAKMKLVSVIDNERRERAHRLEDDIYNPRRFKLNPALLDKEIIVASMVDSLQVIESQVFY